MAKNILLTVVVMGFIILVSICDQFEFHDYSSEATEDNHFEFYLKNMKDPNKQLENSLLEDSPEYDISYRPFMITETFEDYQKYTIKVLEKYSNTKWIDNENQPSGDKFVAKTDAFFIIRARSWKDLDNIKGMQYLAFPLDPSIICLRDLNQNHLPLLRKMLAYKTEIAKLHPGLYESEILVVFHYPVTVSWLHLHYVNIKYAPHEGNKLIQWNLEQVIRNIEIKSDYYQTVELTIGNSCPTKITKCLYSMADIKTGRFKPNALDELEKNCK